MNIAYQGQFLKEGLRILGHNVIDLSFDQHENINAKLDEIHCSIDFVLLELWGEPLPCGIHTCKYKLVAYCIDSSLNEFWTSELCRIFDHVFVDQMSSAPFFKTKGIQAKWLPLCAQSSYFHESCDKKYEITFVGRTSQHRSKKKYLLDLLQKNFPVNIFQDLSVQQMLSVFSQSKVILNENLFNGLTLRLFQGLAAQTIVLTEKGGYGVDKYFRDGEHIICYDDNTLISKLDSILADYNSYAHIAKSGYTICKELHTSKARAHTMLSAIKDRSAFNKRTDDISRKYFETKASYLHTMRFGGRLDSVIADFDSILSTGDTLLASQARLELGNIAARNNDTDKAEQFYVKSLQGKQNTYAYIKLTLLATHRNDIPQAKQWLAQAINLLQQQKETTFADITEKLRGSLEPFEILFVIAYLYYICGDILSLGFFKQFNDEYPDTALETAILAWNLNPSQPIIDLTIDCARRFDVEGELLPYFLDAILKGQLSDKHILYTAEIAKKYYAFDLSGQILAAFKKTIGNLPS